MPNPEYRPIGLFDSGIGGTTVLLQLHHLLPNENLLYLADQAYCPYGSRPPEQIRARAIACSHWLIDQGARLVVVACNTASAVALDHLRRQFPDVLFVGMVPAVKPAALQTRNGVVGVMATPATIQGELLHRVIDQWAAGVRVIAQPCEGLVEQVETGALTTPQTRDLIQTCVAPLIAAGADTIVLGCTHYPFLLPQIQQAAGPDVTILDAAPAVARQVARVLEEHGIAHPGANTGSIAYATTGDPQAFERLIEALELPAGSILFAGSLVKG